MAAATFHLELKKPPRKDDTFAVRIRITKYGVHSYWNVGRSVLGTEWNKTPKRRLKNWVLKNRLAPQINDAIEVALSGLEDIADKNLGHSAAQIKAAYEKKLNPEPEQPEAKPVTFFEYGTEYATRAKETNHGTGQNYEYFLEEFKAVAGEHTPPAELFNERITDRYLKALKAAGNAPSTIAKKVADLRLIYKAGVRAKVLPDIGRPFAGLKVTVPKKKKARPTAEQVRQFLSYEPKTAAEAMAKTVATLQYLLQGARIGEALFLEWENVQENYVEYLPQKGALKPKFIPRSKMLNNLLATLPTGGRYVLPYIGEDYPRLPEKKQHYRKKRIIEQVNQELKEISKALKMGIDLSSHMFRHAFADAIIATGSSVHVAAALLGHANAKTTENYIRDLGLEDTSALALSIFDKLEEKPGKL